MFTDRAAWKASQDWQRPALWFLLLQIAWWSLMLVASIFAMRDAWAGRMIGYSWHWAAPLWVALCLYRLWRPLRALQLGAYRGGPLD